MSRPPTVAAMLKSVADWLDVYDDAAEVGLVRLDRSDTAEAVGAVRGKTVQSDLRLLAAWLEFHPDIDQRMYAVVDVTEGT